MGELFREAGAAAYVLTITGIIAMAYSVLYVRRGLPKPLRVTRGFMWTTFFVGALGFCAGEMNTLRAALKVTEDKRWEIVLEGTMESFNNLILAFAWLAIAALALAVGEMRRRAN